MWTTPIPRHFGARSHSTTAIYSLSAAFQSRSFENSLIINDFNEKTTKSEKIHKKLKLT